LLIHKAAIVQKLLQRPLDLLPGTTHSDGDAAQTKLPDHEDPGAIKLAHHETQEALGLPR
jgi:hypothetical protein